MQLCVLASGSSGNCTVLRTAAGTILIDAGIGPRAALRRLDGTGLRLDDLTAVCLTHLDSDHFNVRWLKTLIQRRVRVLCHQSVAPRLIERVRRWCDDFDDRPAARAFKALVQTFDGECFQPHAELRFTPLHLPHDEHGSHGFVIEGFGRRIGFATDLGRVTPQLLNAFHRLDLLAIESNYDPQMQLASPRPRFLKQRIMAGHGHLSNDQALAAVKMILDRAEASAEPLPRHIVLLHRSRQCNCPDLLRTLFTRDARIAPRLTLTHQHQRTDLLRITPSEPLPGEQMVLKWA
jgi:phosphoribosyl 1,2-cyclic phosphodiesterase